MNEKMKREMINTKDWQRIKNFSEHKHGQHCYLSCIVLCMLKTRKMQYKVQIPLQPKSIGYKVSGIFVPCYSKSLIDCTQ